MKWMILFISVFCSNEILAQKNYPKPATNPNRLFYIQHSQNTNTFVYDANLKNGTFVTDSPLNVYRILYAENGEKKELSGIQKKMAYGVNVSSTGKDSYQFTIKGYPALKWKLSMKNGKPVACLTVNNKTIFVERMFIQTKDNTSGITAKVDYILFTGTNDQNKTVTEKYFPEQ